MARVFLTMENLLVFLATNGIIAYVVYCFIFPPQDCPKISDNFEIGYIQEPEPQPQQVVVKVVKEQKVAKQEEVKNPILNDCKDALISLGVPKRKAKAEVEIIFDRNPNIKTVQEFITEYGKR